MMYGSLDIKCKGQSFLWTIFCPFDPHPLKTWKIKILIKWKKKKQFLEILSFVPLLHKWKSYDVWVLIYGVWQTEFLLTLDHFLPFYSPINPKNNNFDKMKKKQFEILSFYTCVPQMKIIWCMFPEISSMIDRPFCRLGHFLPFYLTNNPQKLKFWKTETKTRRYHHFKQEYQNFWSYAIPFLRYGTWCMKLAFFILSYFLPL